MRLKGTCGDIFFLLVDLLGFGGSPARVPENPPPKAVYCRPRPRLISEDTKQETRRETGAQERNNNGGYHDPPIIVTCDKFY